MAQTQRASLQPPSRIGIVGGGQLGKMMAAEAKRMGYYVAVLDPTPASPAAQVVDHQVISSFTDTNAIRELAKMTDVITFEFEHIDADILCELEAEGYHVCPSGHTLKKIKNKYTQKSMLAEAGLPVPSFSQVNSLSDIQQMIQVYGLPAMLKTCYGGYDGKGNYLITKQEEIEEAYGLLKNHELMLEQFVDFTCELSVMVARDYHGNTMIYPVAENTHKESILRMTKVPAQIDHAVIAQIQNITARTMDVLGDVGVYCIEMFLDRDQKVYINEIAPRPHNSGHYTIEACPSSQYEQIIRVITGMPVGSSKLLSPCAMVNILGDENVSGPYTFEGIENILSKEETYLHLYGKHATTHLKKVGHITVLRDSIEEAEKVAVEALHNIQFKPLDSLHNNTKSLAQIGIIMGSDSDYPVMEEAAVVLKELGIAHEVHIVSAHRTPEKMFEYAKTAEARGISVIIAGAGGSAHLPGMVSALTTLPVIGVPVKSKALDGLDSLLSIVQMPYGIPVATVAINDARNAGLLAAKMLSTNNFVLKEKLDAYLS